MSRTRKRRVVNWGPVLGLLIAGNLAAGAFFSPLTAVRRVRVVGAQTEDQATLEKLLGRLKGVPFGRVNARAVESEAARIGAVRTASLRRNLFGSAVLTLEYRQPLARLANARNVLIDRDGVLFGRSAPPPGLPVVQVEPEMLVPNLTLANTWPTATAAQLASRLQAIPAIAGSVLHLDSRGRLWIMKAGQGRVDLGGAESLEEKLSQLRKLLAQRPTLLAEVKSLNLTDPKRPAIVPLNRP